MRCLLCVTLLGFLAGFAAGADKPRLLILTDIGGDPDDQQALVRLLLYANEFEIEGLIASAAGTPNELKQKVTKPELIRELVTAYGEVRDNLAKQAAGYPTAAELLAKTKAGNANRGRAAIGEGHDTEGSRAIIAAGDRSEERPLDIAIWGGQTDLAQALWRVRADRGERGLAAFQQQLRIYDIADQDGIAAWMHEEFPGLFYVLASAPPGRDKREGLFRGMYLGGDESLTSREWMETHIRQGHGPLGALYPPRTWTAPNPAAAIKEGDTPSWLYFLPHGVNDPNHPEWGGFGGRFAKSENGVFRDAHDKVGETTDARATVWRWRPAFQADFQARLEWCVATTLDQANHAPVAVLNGDGTREIVSLVAKAGQTVELTAQGSTDLDADSLRYAWSVYPEAGTYRGEVRLTAASGPQTTFAAPPVSEPATVHVVLEVTDAGTPALTTYRRAVVRIETR